jgi:MFS superfamily sulfate permease-like transporter
MVSEWVSSLFSGILTGTITVIASVSPVALIFRGDLSSHVAFGTNIALISASLIGLTVSLSGSCGMAVAIPQDRTAPILAIMAAAIAANASSTASSEEVPSSVLLTIVVTTFITGAFLLALGLARGGGLMRFIPYSVLGGYFAGTGWLLTIGGLRVMTGLELSSIAEVPELASADLLGPWLPGFVLELAIFAVIRFVSFAVALPLALITATGLFCVLMLGNGETVETLGNSGWLASVLWPLVPRTVADRYHTQLRPAEYLVVPLILLIIAAAGFVEGVLVGLLVALTLFVVNCSRTQVVRYALSGEQIKSSVERNLEDVRYLRAHGAQLYVLNLRGYLFFR